MGRIALFGGTFDPIHNAHLAVAREAAAKFSLGSVLFVPSYHPPHKAGAKASFEDRVRMCELACAEDVMFSVSRVEEGTETSYSFFTIEKLEAEFGQRLSFVIGADAFAELASWYRADDVVRAVDFIVVTRPGAVYGIPAGASVQELPGMDLAVSSSEIRDSIAQGKFDVPVAPAVIDYIRTRGLYGATQCVIA